MKSFARVMIVSSLGLCTASIGRLSAAQEYEPQPDYPQPGYPQYAPQSAYPETTPQPAYPQYAPQSAYPEATPQPASPQYAPQSAYPGGTPQPAYPEAGPQPSTPETAAPSGQGPEQFILQALSQLQLRPEQTQALQELRSSLEGSDTVVENAQGDLLSALADQLAAGRVDRNALQPQINALVEAVQEASPAMRGFLEELHSILDPAQRAQLANAIQQAMQAGAQPDSSRQMVDALASQLGLSEQQKGQILASMEQSRPMAEQGQQQLARLLEAFKADQFSVDQVIPQTEVPAHAEEMAEGTVSMIDTLARTLTPEQRARLADTVRQSIGTRAIDTRSTEGSLVVGRGFVGRGYRPGVAGRGYYPGMRGYGRYRPGFRHFGHPHPVYRHHARRYYGHYGPDVDDLFFGFRRGYFGPWGTVAGFTRGGVGWRGGWGYMW